MKTSACTSFELVLCMHQKGFFIAKLDKARAYILIDSSLWRCLCGWHRLLEALRWQWPLQIQLGHAVSNTWNCLCVCSYACVNLESVCMFSSRKRWGSFQSAHVLVCMSIYETSQTTKQCTYPRVYQSKNGTIQTSQYTDFFLLECKNICMQIHGRWASKSEFLCLFVR